MLAACQQYSVTTAPNTLARVISATLLSWPSVQRPCQGALAEAMNEVTILLAHAAFNRLPACACTRLCPAMTDTRAHKNKMARECKKWGFQIVTNLQHPIRCDD
jgi:hypothetical protein